MTEPFCWIAGAALRAIRSRVEGPDRKAARLVLLALAEMAMDAYDGEHVGFTATVAEVCAAAEVSENTYSKARRALEGAEVLIVERSGNANLWTLVTPGAPATVGGCRPQPLGGPATRQEAVEEGRNGLLTEPSAAELDPVGVVFARWQEVVPGKAGCRLTPGRREKIRARLRSFSVEQLVRVVEQVARDDFLNGKNDRGKPFNDFRTIFRNDEKVEELLEDADRHERGASKAAMNGRDNGDPGYQQRVDNFKDALASFGGG